MHPLTFGCAHLTLWFVNFPIRPPPHLHYDSRTKSVLLRRNMLNMNRLLYIAFMETIESSAANNYPCLLQGEFLQYASFALVSEDYRVDADNFDLLHKHLPSVGVVS
jgi:hypothetical protein